jgi:hypothetical protein
MRLADALIAAAGSPDDELYGGSMGSFAEAVAVAEKYELHEEVRLACVSVTGSKPSSLLSALPYLRAPYAQCWFEWTLPAGETLAKLTCRRPVRVGCLIHAGGPAQGAMHVALDWQPGGPPEERAPCLLPYAALFDWGNEINLSPAELRQLGAGMRVPRAEALPHLGECWPDAPNAAEQQALELISSRMAIVPNRVGHCAGWWRHGTLSRDEQLRMMAIIDHVWILFTAAIALLNARNAVRQEREDLAPLNRKRRRKGRPALQEFRLTYLYVPQIVVERYGPSATAEQRAAMRRHLVRGHYKVRKTGIYWWSPFVRGGGAEKIVRRRQYGVRGSSELERYVKNPGSLPRQLEAER